VKLGVAVFQTDLSLGVTDIARAVEDAGLESLFFVEHTHTPVSSRDVLQGPNKNDAHILDPFTSLGAAAAVTSRIRLGTGVCLVAQHDPIILARQVATLDHLSDGRFLFGIGAGWVPDEMRNHGLEPRLRWRVMREKVLAMEAIWTQDEAAFHGSFVSFNPILSWPKPVQKPHPPVLVGGNAPLSLRAAASYGDGWMPLIDEIVTFEEQLAEVQRLCDEAGRRPIPVTACPLISDEHLMTRCVELGVDRFVDGPPEIDDLPALQRFLDDYADRGRRAGILPQVGEGPVS
jgi:probable F420-dependent oxidoreductase